MSLTSNPRSSFTSQFHHLVILHPSRRSYPCVPVVESFNPSDRRIKYRQRKNSGQRPHVIGVVIRHAELHFGLEATEKRVDDRSDQYGTVNLAVGQFGRYSGVTTLVRHRGIR
jgi:hypothetical protein